MVVISGVAIETVSYRHHLFFGQSQNQATSAEKQLNEAIPSTIHQTPVLNLNSNPMGSTNVTNASPSGGATDDMAVTIMIPCFFGVLLILGLVIACLGMRRNGDSPSDSHGTAAMKYLSSHGHLTFKEWVASLKDFKTGRIPSNPICSICLDNIEPDAEIHGLACFHVYHRECLDAWIAAQHDTCPLCQRSVMGEEDEEQATKKRQHTRMMTMMRAGRVLSTSADAEAV